MTYERQAMVDLLRSPGMVFYDGGSDKCALLRTVANQIEADGQRIEALEAEVKRKDRALWALTAWLLHRFGPNTPEGVEAQTARAALGEKQ